MDGAALGEVARRAAAHDWSFSAPGLDDAVRALGWEVAGRHGPRVDLSPGVGSEPAWAMFYDDGEYYLEASLIPPVDVDPDDYKAVDDVEVAMYAAFMEAAESVRAAVGEPVFCDGRAHPRFPDDDDEDGVEWLAYWTTATCRLSVKQLHQDQELPYCLSFVVEPPD